MATAQLLPPTMPNACFFIGSPSTSRVFGHFEKPLFMELCKHVETKFVPAGAILFRRGQMDDSIYVVKNGRLKVFIVEPVCLANYDPVCVGPLALSLPPSLPPRMEVSYP